MELMDNIMELSKIESGIIKFVDTDVDVNEIIDEIKQIYIEGLSKNVKVIVDTPFEDFMIITDRKYLTKVLFNLMSNSVKFTKTGTITIGYCTPKNGLIRFYIKDTGCGIPKDKFKTIFCRFVKLNKFEQGTGLGLSLCQLIVEKMKGNIGVSSELGKGSDFWFEIPYRKSNKVIS